MKTMQIFEPAMCCPTGLCGVSVDPELLRISTALDTLNKHGVTVDRFNLSNAPMEFVSNKIVNDFINDKGPDGLPVTVLDGKILVSGRYPTNEELTEWLGLSADLLKNPAKHNAGTTADAPQEGCESQDCCCNGGCC